MAFFDEDRRNLIAFFILGLTNNSPWVIMVAGATEISDGGVALVYLSNILPGLLVKASSPYWFDLVPYPPRILACSLLYTGCLFLVAFGHNLGIQLMGVGLASLSCGLGEASILALSSKYDTKALTAWGSGTGFAGIFGYTWMIVLHNWLNLSFTLTLMLALALPLSFIAAYFLILVPISPQTTSQQERLLQDEKALSPVRLTAKEKFQLSLSLWRYTVPLVIVYFAEYCLQSGAWSAMGFPVTDEEARHDFYGYANWTYQFGVLVSRSSGVIYRATMTHLWVYPFAQVGLLVFFAFDAVYHWWYSPSVIALAFVVGIFGGLVYINAFRMIGEDIPPSKRELAMSAASVASDIGVLLSSGSALVLQACLFEANNISGATIDLNMCHSRT